MQSEKRWLKFKDLERRGIVDNWTTLRNWQKDPRIGFPLGRKLGPNTTAWSEDDDINPWLASRPTQKVGA
jgi:predicted DNA-binding transcriptional regulator AlpA